MSKELRQVHAEVLIELAGEHKNLKVLEADLAGCLCTNKFVEAFSEQFIQCGIAEANMIGVTAVTNGGTHMPFEDVGLMRLIPESVVIEVSDQHVLKKAMHYGYHNPGVNYIRCMRKGLPDLYKSADDIEIGKGSVLRDGTDLTIVASGISVHDALEAATMVEQNTGKSVAVIDMHTSSDLPFLKATYGISAEDIAAKASELLG